MHTSVDNSDDGLHVYDARYLNQIAYYQFLQHQQSKLNGDFIKLNENGWVEQKEVLDQICPTSKMVDQYLTDEKVHVIYCKNDLEKNAKRRSHLKQISEVSKINSIR